MQSAPRRAAAPRPFARLARSLLESPRRTCIQHAGLATMNSILGIHEAALTFRAQRMEVIAANLANADTPHYKAEVVEVRWGVSGSMNAVEV